MNTARYLLATVSVLLVGVLSVSSMPLTAAAESDLLNSHTGSGSENANTVQQDSSVSVRIDNRADVSNSFDFDLNTGGNTVSDNTIVGNIRTGDINADAAAQTQANTASLSLDTASENGEVSLSATNQVTGSNSINRNDVNASRDFELSVENNANVTNRLDLNVNTGNNDIRDNTQVGNIRTGDIDVSVLFETDVNRVSVVGPTPEGPGGGPGGGGPVGGEGPGAGPQGPPPLVTMVPRGGAEIGLPRAGVLPSGVGGFFPAGGTVVMLLLPVAAAAAGLFAQLRKGAMA